MAKTAKPKPKINVSKVTALGGKAAAPMRRAKKSRKGAKSLKEVKAAIDAKNPTYVSPVSGGMLPGTGPKIDPSKLIPEGNVDDELSQRVSANEAKITSIKNILKLDISFFRISQLFILYRYYKQKL